MLLYAFHIKGFVMLIIKNLTQMINKEIREAEKYAQRSVSYKENDPALAETFYLNLVS